RRRGVVVRQPPGRPPGSGSGLVASAHCPPAAVTVEQRVPPPPEVRSGRTGLSSLSSLSSYESGFEARLPTNGSNGSSSPTAPTNGSTQPAPSFDDAPTYQPSTSSQVDEPFGPLADLPPHPIDDPHA